ncbi:MAG TPA: DMT family transporter [Burkholderiaceae bacterium]
MQSLWMLAACFAFTLMSVCVKLGAESYSTAEMIFYRGVIGTAFLWGMARYNGVSLKTDVHHLHLTRGLVGVTSLWLSFYGLTHLPLATASTLAGMSSIWVAAMLFIGAWWHGTRRTEPGLVLAIAASFIGVVLVLQPTFDADQWVAGVVTVLAGMLSAVAYLSVRTLGQRGEPENRVVFYFSLISIVAGAVACFVQPWLSSSGEPAWHSHTPRSFALLVAIGLCATGAQIAMTRAYSHGNTLVTANLQYTGIVFSSLAGILIWNDVLGWHSWLGIAVILASGMAATYYNARKRPAAPPAPTQPA